VVEFALCLYGVGANVDVSPVPATFHNDGRASVAFQRRIMNRWVDAAHNSRLAYGDAHLAFDHKGDATEHSLFLGAAAVPN
jgi:hypothetical protein